MKLTKEQLLQEAESMILGLQEFEGRISLSRDDLKDWMVMFHQQILRQTVVSGSFPLCDHSDCVSTEDKDHAIITTCLKCGESRRQ